MFARGPVKESPLFSSARLTLGRTKFSLATRGAWHAACTWGGGWRSS